MSAALQRSEVISQTPVPVKPRSVAAQLPTIEAGDITAVCKKGGLVAIYFATPHGELPVRCSLKSFLARCRGAKDHHGQPFEPDAARINFEAIAQADAAAVPITKGAPGTGLGKRSLSGNRYGKVGLPIALVDKLRWAFQQGDKPSEAARKIGVCANTAYDYFRRFREQAAAKQPVAKPNGKLL